MKKISTLTLCLLTGFSLAFGQQTLQVFQHEVQFNSLMEFDVNGNRFGGQVEYNKSIFVGDGKAYQLSLGLVEEFFVKDERDLSGITGNTFSNILGLTLSNKFAIPVIEKLSVANTIYAGWGHRNTEASYVNEAFGIDRARQSSFNYFAFGAYWKLAYQFREKLSVQAIGKTDFSRLVDSYEPTIFERPGFMYGLGLAYTLK